MADLRLSELDTIGGSSVADADLFAVLDVSDTGGTSGGAGGTDKSITEVELLKMIRRHFDVVQVIASSGATLSVDLANGRVADVTLDANCAITFTNPTAATPRSTPVTLILRQDSGGGNTPSFTDTILWAGGTEPSYSLGADEIDVLTFFTLDNGTTWFGFAAGLAMA